MLTEPHGRISMSHPCNDGTLFGSHEWVETYYGTQCRRCETFYPHGCAPWDDDMREGFDFGDDSGPEDEWDEWDDYEEDGPLDLEDQLDNALDRPTQPQESKP